MQATTTPEVSLNKPSPLRLGNLPVRSTRGLINRDTKFCVLCYAPAKRGKTRFGATLDTLSKKHFGKPAIFVALEPSEGGGTMSICETGAEVDIVTPSTYSEYNAVIAQLLNDTTYGAVIVDSVTEYVNRFLKPHVLDSPNPKAKFATRAMGVPDQTDYQTMGELCRQDMNKLIGMTTNPRVERRKHLMITALEKEKWSRPAPGEESVLLKVHPDLPGAMADVATAIFQTVASIDLKTSVHKETKQRTTRRELCTQATEESKRIVGDRTGLIPNGSVLDYVEIYEKLWMPKLAELEART
jgi:hypothetical protein